MESALNDFPNLKALGGFDAFPDVAREGIRHSTNTTLFLIVIEIDVYFILVSIKKERTHRRDQPRTDLPDPALR